MENTVRELPGGLVDDKSKVGNAKGKLLADSKGYWKRGEVALLFSGHKRSASVY